jgi:hypothetical protein
MPVTIRGKDMKEMVHGGRYNDSRNFPGLAGVPYGDGAVTNWSKPNPFGITYQNQDLCNWYSAPYEDYYGNTTKHFPAGVKAIKIICIGGGGGGGGGTSSFNSENSDGAAGGGGGAGGTAIGYMDVGGNKYCNIVIGGGGSGSHYEHDYGGYKFVALGSGNGGDTYVDMGGQRILAHGGAVGEQGQANVRHGNGGGGGGGYGSGGAAHQAQFNGGGGGVWDQGGGGGTINQGNNSNYPAIPARGNGGQGGHRGWANGIYNPGSYGKGGDQGICRIYFLY